MTPDTAYAITVSCLADLNTDGQTNGADLCVLLAQYGNAGIDPVQAGECPSYAVMAQEEAAFRESIADNPQSVGSPYPPMGEAFIVGDFNRDGTIDGQDLSVLLADFGCTFTTENAEIRGGQP